MLKLQFDHESFLPQRSSGKLWPASAVLGDAGQHAEGLDWWCYDLQLSDQATKKVLGVGKQ